MNLKISIADHIKRLRLSLMIHSIIYYEYNANIISDAEWSKRAQTLVKLQSDYPEIASEVILADLYKDFDGSTGFDLAKKADEGAYAKARYLMAMKRIKYE